MVGAGVNDGGPALFLDQVNGGQTRTHEVRIDGSNAMSEILIFGVHVSVPQAGCL